MALTARRPGVAFAPPRGLPGVAVAALGVVALAAEQGGYFASAWRAGAAAFAAAAALLWLWSGETRVPRLALAPPMCLAALCLWSVASASWSAVPSASFLDVQRTLLYLAASAAFAVAGDGLVTGVGAGGTVVAVWALGARLAGGAPADPYEGALLTGPIGYANGLGALVAIAAVVWIALALERRRLFFLAPLAVLAPALVLTESRGAWAGAVVGAAVAAAVAARRRAVAAVVLVIASAALALLLAVPHVAPGDRAAYWNAARHLASLHPLRGTGAGTFDVVYHGLLPGHDAHSLYLQALVELGAVGLVLIVALFAVPLVAALRRSLAAPAAGLTVYLLAAGVDWDWQLPAVTVAALALSAASLRNRRA
jgi:O-antigen ligase